MAKKKESLSLEERLEKALLSDSEQPYKVPSNWVWTRLSEVVSIKTGKKDKKTALQTILYTIWMIIASVIPAFGFTGRLFLTKISTCIVVVLGLWMLFYAFKLHKEMDAKAARKLMIVSVSYISLLQIVYVLDKFLR